VDGLRSLSFEPVMKDWLKELRRKLVRMTSEQDGDNDSEEEF
jgi:hypothetical protein